jgi:hypothetical protein
MYLIDPNGNYPRHMGDLLLEVPEWQETDALPPGWVDVAPGVIPAFDSATQTFDELPPALVDGVLTRQFAVRNLTTEEASLLIG